MYPLAGLWLSLVSGTAATVHFSEYILAPASRDLQPKSVYGVNGSVENAAALTDACSGGATFHTDAAVTYDYGKNIGGLASFHVESVSGSGQQIGISFTESSLWISPRGGDATHDTLIDEIIWFDIIRPGNYSLDAKHERGGFRYLNLYHRGSGTVTLSKLNTRFTAMPHYGENGLRNYTGWFHCDDEKLNLVWYAGAYTNQLCTIPAHLGLSLQPVSPSSDATSPWWSNSTLLEGPAALVDGAKRDRLLWSGDLAHELTGVLLTTNDVNTVKATLGRLVLGQRANGAFPYFGKPVVVEPDPGIGALADSAFSFTYHLHILIKLADYYAYTNDARYVKDNYFRIPNAVNWALGYTDLSGLANVSRLPQQLDWAPKRSFEGHNLAANALLVHGLKAATKLAGVAGDSKSARIWMAKATALSEKINNLFWDTGAGLYRNNENATLYPQDGNAFAILAGIADSTRAATVSDRLRARWTDYGAPAPEAFTTVSPFVSGFELESHFIAGKPQNAIDLMRLMWHDFMLRDPRMTGSSFIEGYDVSGELHYPAYANDPRVSHAHGWATGPTTSLMTYVAGIHVLNASQWLVHPQVGELRSVHAGFTVGAGSYAVDLNVAERTTRYTLSTPHGTTGTVVLDVPPCRCLLSIHSLSSRSNFSFTKRVSGSADGRIGLGGFWRGGVSSGSVSDDGKGHNGTVVVQGVPGGSYVVEIRCT